MPPNNHITVVARGHFAMSEMGAGRAGSFDDDYDDYYNPHALPTAEIAISPASSSSSATPESNRSTTPRFGLGTTPNRLLYDVVEGSTAFAANSDLLEEERPIIMISNEFVFTKNLSKTTVAELRKRKNANRVVPVNQENPLRVRT
jgi:hypothetical protein